MRTIILSALLLTSSMSAMTLDEIITSSLAKSPSLNSINERIAANKQTIAAANQFSNPDVSLTKNTLSSTQKMSQTVISVKQNLPYYSKRDKRQKVAIADDAVLNETLNAAKVRLVAQIKKEAYTVWELKELYKIIDNYISLTEGNIELYEAYTSVSNDSQHMGIMKAKLSLSDLEIQKSLLNSKIYSAMARLSYLAALDIKNLDINLNIGKKPNLNKLQSLLTNNPDIAIKTKEILKENAKVNLADINNYPDFNLIAGYAQRENFDNYMNIGVSVSLPIYGTEDIKEEEARAMVLSVKSEKEDVKISINSKLKVYYAQMTSAYEIYHIVQDDALPQVAHMFELSNSSISTGSDLFKYIDVLFQKLDLEEQSITAVSNYNRANAKISQLAGDLK